MISNKKLTAVLSGIVLTFCANIPAFAADSTAANLAGDSVITTKIKAELLADKAVSSLNISVNTSNGVVTLGGMVPTDKEASLAIEKAAATEGVTDVDASQLMVKKSTHPYGDMVITAKVKGTFVKDKLFGDKAISITGVSVETKDGIVYLTGQATSDQAANAVKLAKLVKGVKGVESKISVL